MTGVVRMDADRANNSASSSAPSSFRLRVYRILSGADSARGLGRVVAIGLTALILLNVAASVLETVHALHQRWAQFFLILEGVSVTVFTIEYLLRLWACTVDLRYARSFVGRVRYALTPLMLIDLVAIAPFYAASLIQVDLRTLRAIRLVRLLRVLKIARYSESLQLLGRVLVSRRSELFVTLIAVLVLLVVSSTLMYHVERDAQPDQFSSIPAAMWWSVETLTTIGYGDMLPVTTVGKLINSFIALLGIGLFALPAGILGSGFVEELHRRRDAPVEKCPHCGLPLKEPGHTEQAESSATRTSTNSR